MTRTRRSGERWSTAARGLALGCGILSLTGMTAEWPDFDAWWDYGAPAATEVRFRELRERHPPDLDYRLQLETQLARTLGLQGQFAEASDLLEGIEPELAGASAETQVRWLLEMGRTLNSAGDTAAAQVRFESAWTLARDEGLEGYAVDAGHMVAIAAGGAEGIRLNRLLVEYARESDAEDARRWLGSLYNNLGWGLFEAGDYTAALAAHREGEAFWIGRDEPARLRIARWSAAKMLRYLDRCEEALVVQTELELAWVEAGEPDGFVYEELGECLSVLGENEKARLNFRRAYDLLSADSWFAEHEAERLARLQRLGAPG